MRAHVTVRALLGAVYLMEPQWIPGLLGVPVDSRARVVVRILGARQLLHAALVAAMPSPLTRLLGSGVDALHAGSMLALAALDKRWRRAALTDAAVAIALAGGGRVSGRRLHNHAATATSGVAQNY